MGTRKAQAKATGTCRDCGERYEPKKPMDMMCMDCRDKLRVYSAAVAETMREKRRPVAGTRYTVVGVGPDLERATEKMLTKRFVAAGAANREKLRNAQDARWNADRAQTTEIVKKAKRLHNANPLLFGVRKMRAEEVAKQTGVNEKRVMRILERNRA